MDLWVRSQGKNILQKVNKLYVTTYAEENGYGIYDIQEVDDCDIALGFYKTRERALEVLDKIHQRLINLGTIEIVPDSYTVLPKDTSNVYEMPKE